MIFQKIYNETLSNLENISNLAEFSNLNVFERENYNTDIVPVRRAKLLQSMYDDGTII
jgi:hypothetical protein